MNYLVNAHLVSAAPTHGATTTQVIPDFLVPATFSSLTE